MRKGPFAAQDLVAISTLGMEFAVAVAMGTAAGYLADLKMQFFPWCTVIGVMMGFGLGMYIVVKEAKRMEKAASKDKK